MKSYIQFIVISYITSLSLTSTFTPFNKGQSDSTALNIEIKAVDYPNDHKEIKDIMSTLSRKYEIIHNKTTKSLKKPRKAIMALPLSGNLPIKAIDLVKDDEDNRSDKNQNNKDNNGENRDEPVTLNKRLDGVDGKGINDEDLEEENPNEEVNPHEEENRSNDGLDGDGSDINNKRGGSGDIDDKNNDNDQRITDRPEGGDYKSGDIHENDANNDIDEHQNGGNKNINHEHGDYDSGIDQRDNLKSGQIPDGTMNHDNNINSLNSLNKGSSDKSNPQNQDNIRLSNVDGATLLKDTANLNSSFASSYMNSGLIIDSEPENHRSYINDNPYDASNNTGQNSINQPPNGNNQNIGSNAQSFKIFIDEHKYSQVQPFSSTDQPSNSILQSQSFNNVSVLQEPSIQYSLTSAPIQNGSLIELQDSAKHQTSSTQSAHGDNSSSLHRDQNSSILTSSESGVFNNGGVNSRTSAFDTNSTGVIEDSIYAYGRNVNVFRRDGRPLLEGKPCNLGYNETVSALKVFGVFLISLIVVL